VVSQYKLKLSMKALNNDCVHCVYNIILRMFIIYVPIQSTMYIIHVLLSDVVEAFFSEVTDRQ